MSACCHAPSPAERPAAGSLIRLGLAALVAAQSMIFGLAVNLSPPQAQPRAIIHAVLALSAVIVFALVGGPLVREALAAAREKRIVVEQLFLLSIFGAFAASLQSSLTGVGGIYYEVVAVLLAIYTFGRLLLARQQRSVMAVIESFVSEFDSCEIFRSDGSTESVSIDCIHRGDRVLIRVGEAISIDGQVVSGEAFVRESALTGELFPVVKRPGDSVFSGSYVLDGPLVVEAAQPGRTRKIDRLLAAIRTARTTGSPLQRQLDRVTTWFLPAVLAVSFATFACWSIRSGWLPALFHALAVLVVACPCSLGLAVPISLWTTLLAFARRGLMVSDPAAIDRLATVDTVLFDKTGTLGEEALTLVDFVVVPGADRSAVLARVGAVQSSTQHPIARAFAPSALTVTNFRLLPAQGVEASVEARLMTIGNETLLSLESRAAAQVLAPQLRGGREAARLIYVLEDSQLVAVALLREALRSSARAALRSLSDLGLSCRVLTGDQAAHVAVHQLDVPCESNLSPEEKSARVESFRRNGATVLFVGDGINDSAAMAQADVAIALDTGTGLAANVAAIVAPSRDLGAIPFAFARARRMRQVIRGNLIFALVYNVAGISFAAAGLIHPVAAVLLMTASSFTVTWRALRDSQNDPA